MNSAMKNRGLGRTEMGGSEDDEKSPIGKDGFPAHSPLALFGRNGVTWGNPKLVPSTDPGVVTGETL